MPKPKLDPAHKKEVERIKSYGGICATFTWVPCRVCLTPAPKELTGENKHLTCTDPIAEPQKRAVKKANQEESLF